MQHRKDKGSAIRGTEIPIFEKNTGLMKTSAIPLTETDKL